jgi:serine protease
VAGSDADNDLFICDAGEACGAWLTVDQPLEINLDANREDINFPVDYVISIPTIADSKAGPSADASAALAQRRRDSKP